MTALTGLQEYRLAAVAPAFSRILQLSGCVAAIAGVIHYYMQVNYMQVKADVRQPLVFAAVLAILLGHRLAVYRRQPNPVPATAPAVKPKKP